MVNPDTEADESRRSSFANNTDGGRRRSNLYRQGSNMSDASFFTDVEMAHDEVFAGPVSESVPTRVASFAHRRNRADSTTSFTYYDDEQQSDDDDAGDLGTLQDDDVHSIIDGVEDFDGYAENGHDLELGRRPSRSIRRKSSGFSRRYSTSDANAPLIPRPSYDSSNAGDRWKEGRVSQKIYIITEDLTIVVAGFNTSKIGFTVYTALCVATLGIAWLLFRWLPRWRVKLIGVASPLSECEWVAIENQWGEFAIQNILKQKYGRPLSTVFGRGEKHGMLDREDDDDPILNQLRCLDYRYIRFCYHPLRDKFILGNTWKDPAWTDVTTLRTGLDSDEKDFRERVFGKNLIELEEKSTGQLLVDEAFHPFYVFQIISLIFWSLDEYYYYSGCIFIISVISIVTTLIDTKATMRRLREVSRFECDVRVLRNGFWRNVESSELVPGDVFEITDPNLTQLPCDGLLLSGDCIVNESMLTGESVPISKTPMTDDALDYLNLSATSIHPEVAKHLLFCGTKIVRARRPQNDSDEEAAALAMAIRTGFNTTKGALVRSMVFPKPSGFKFYRDTFRYISVMAVVAFIGFVVSLINFIRLGLAWYMILVRAADLITIIVPPALPATLAIGTNFALSRLKGKQIFCISPQRVNVCGKLDIVCFDKTGTLTEEGLDVLGLRVAQPKSNRFSELYTETRSLLPGLSDRDPTIEYEMNKSMLYAMATCHSLRSIDNELMGDPLDIKMFQFTDWEFEEGENRATGADDEDQRTLAPSVARPSSQINPEVFGGPGVTPNQPIELGILKSFEFVSQLRRASVVVRQFGAQRGDVFVKGAPECMKEICRPESFPSDYEELLSFYTHRGFRVIACATKSIPKLSWVKSQKMTRMEAESNLNFIGFIIFENKLKPATTGIINQLGEARIRTVMCTGDNILTAISVARECNLIDRTAHCFVPHFIEGDSRTPLAKLSWESVDNPAYQLDENTLKPLPPPADQDASLPYDISDLRNYSIAVSGDVFRWIIDFASEKVLREMLVLGQVFARMSPDEKHELVEKLQAIDYCCGFCGDGANDCGALKAADVGISLSEAEASVAAPFTSRVFDISCVPEVIREGRAALVTSFSCFKYMSLYSAIQFTTVSFLYASASNLGDFQFLFIDLFLNLPIAIFMGWTGPYPALSRRRPTAKLMSKKVLTPLIGQMILCIIVQTITFIVVRRQPWFIPPVVDIKKANPRNSETTSLFYVSCYQYILSAIVLSIGPPFRQPMLKNTPFVVIVAAALLVSTYLLFNSAHRVSKTMDLTQMPTSFKFNLLLLSIVGFVFAHASENWFFPRLAELIGKVVTGIKGGKNKKKRKQYKVILEDMR